MARAKRKSLHSYEQGSRKAWQTWKKMREARLKVKSEPTFHTKDVTNGR